MNRLTILSIILLTSFLYGALPPSVQKRIDLEMMQENLLLQNESPIVLEALVVKKEELLPSKGVPIIGSYDKEIILTLKPIKTIRNKNKKSLENNFKIKYFVLVANGMVGPKIFNIQIPKKDKNYIFYLNDDYTLSAKNYSIDTLDNDLQNEALENPIEFMKDFEFIDRLRDATKYKIKKFLSKHDAMDALVLIGHTGLKGTQEYNLSLSMSKAQATKKFIIEELGYKKVDIQVKAYGESKPRCTEKNQDNYKKKCEKVNPRVTIKVIPFALIPEP